jgi:hypothetical protein
MSAVKDMATKEYDWKRYWVPRDGSFAFDFEGFLAPPSNDGGWSWQKTDVVGFHELAAKPCLVLLGEPGIGKSIALGSARKHVLATRPSARVLFRNLGEYGDEGRLIEEIFESPEFTAWSSTGGELHVFLDSFDECLLRLDTVAALLAERIRRVASVDGLFFRIASRTAEWRMGLEEAMRQKWGEERVKVYELAPLTKQQVQVAVTANTADVSKFMREVIGREVVSFAIKPLTLDLLLRIWKTGGGSLPPTQREIYERGCLELCAESNPDRQTPRLRHELSAEHRLSVASRIAAATVFCKRSAIWIGLKPSHKLETDVSRSELAYGPVLVAGQEALISDKAIRETLDTGLFTARGPDRLGWAHQTYAEYLAARYLHEQQFTSRQIFDLILHPNDPDKKLVPQLQEVAAWIAGNDKTVFQRLVGCEPNVLLRSDIAMGDGSTKAKLVQALLLAAGTIDFRPDWWALRKRYGKLKHPGLSAQVRKVLLSRKASSAGQVEAVRMIEACEIDGLFSLLVDLALDPLEDQEVRETSAGLVSRLGNNTTKRRLKPLALGACGADPKDELRAAGLRACWPGVISADQLFANLKEPCNHHLGSYSLFLESHLVDGLTPADLPRALRWVADQPEDHDSTTKFYRLMKWIVGRAAAHLEQAEVLEAFAIATLARLRKLDFGTAHEYQDLVSVFEAHPDRRLQVVQAMLPHFQDLPADSMFLTHWGFPFVRSGELDWLLSRLTTETSVKEQRKLSHLVLRIFYPDDARRIDSVITVAQGCAVLADVLAVWFAPVILGSEAATKAKGDFDQRERWAAEAAQRRERRGLKPPPGEHIHQLLNQFESGGVDAWWQICTWVELEDNGHPASKSHHIDLHDLPGWGTATAETRIRLLGAAPRYIAARGAAPEVWFHWKGKIHRPALGGVRALLLLAKEAPAQFESLSKDVWSQWLPAILRLPAYDEEDKFRLLATRAFREAPQDAIAWTLKVVQEENREGDNLWVLGKLPTERDSSLESALLAKLRKGMLKPRCANQLLEWLVDRGVNAALEVPRWWISRPSLARKRQRDRALFGARLLFKHGDTKDWKGIRGLIDSDPAFGKSLLEGISDEHRHGTVPLLMALSEAEIAALWEWMLRQYPMAEDPPERHSSGGVVTTRWAVADMRDGLLGYLAEMGTPASCQVLLGLMEKYPAMPWLRGFLSRAKEQTRRNTWQPPTPIELFRLSEDRRNRFVQSADQLLDVLCDSLIGLQQKLQAETPAAPSLWDKDRPKDEGALSNWVKIELQAALIGRGIILNREVQIHIAERTDIHVDAVARGARGKELDHLKVIIEAKGCWNREIRTAMETQLVNRYLRDNDCKHGIYLVGWFLCDAWSKRDPRRISLKLKTLKGLTNYVTRQADQLSSPEIQIRAVVLDAHKR